MESVADAANDSKGFKEAVNGSIDYRYDANGNIKEDANKNISEILYNHLNLPTKVTFSTGETIEWVYDAAGVKLYKITTDNAPEPITTRKDYVGGIEYTGGILEAVYHSEGRLVPTSTSDYQYEYTVKDHLGNARVSFADLDKDGEIVQSEILQTNHYYPFGMLHEPNIISGTAENAYQYN